MKIKRIKKIRVNAIEFKIKWDNSYAGAFFDYKKHIISIGIKDIKEDEIFSFICHELMEITAIEINVRMGRPDCDSDYLFVYDHRQFDTMANMFSGLIEQFIG